MNKKVSLKKIFKYIGIGVDTAIYAICVTFVGFVTIYICKEIIEVAAKEPVMRYYLFGFLLIVSLCLSISYIINFHNKYFKNDSNPSKRQNDFFFERDIRREEEHNTDR